jgi:hypothetical protein
MEPAGVLKGSIQQHSCSAGTWLGPSNSSCHMCSCVCSHVYAPESVLSQADGYPEDRGCTNCQVKTGFPVMPHVQPVCHQCMQSCTHVSEETAAGWLPVLSQRTLCFYPW